MIEELFLEIKYVITNIQNISFIKIDLEYKKLVMKPPKNTPINIPKASELLTRA